LSLKPEKVFLKFWWDEELKLLKEAAVNANNIWKAANKPKQGAIFEKSKKRAYYTAKVSFYKKEL